MRSIRHKNIIHCLSPSCHTTTPYTFSPHRVLFNALTHPRAYDDHASSGARLLVEALRNAGIVSVRDVPGYAVLCKLALSSLPAYADASNGSVDHKFPNRTVQTTLTTRTVPGTGGAQDAPGVRDAEGCRAFEEASRKLRTVVDGAIRAFSEWVLSVLGGGVKTGNGRSPGVAILETEDEYEFPTFTVVVENGEHLEHFHSYRGDAAAKSADGNDTINFYVNQGLFEHARVLPRVPR